MVRVVGFLTSFWLIGGEVTGSCFRNPNHQASGTKHSGPRWSHHSPPGWGFLVPTEKFKDMFQIAIYIPSEKAMAPHSSTLAWKIPWMEEPRRLQSMGSLRVRHDWVTSLSLFTFMHWRRKWQPTPVFLPGESQGRGSLVGCRLWGRTESDTTEATQQEQGSVLLLNYFYCFLA